MKEIENLDDGQNKETATAEEEEEQQDPRVAKFTVQNPVKISNHVKYTVTGVDDEGDFSEVRRFREFDALSKALSSRWPGCYVPSIPEKSIQLSQKNNDEFVEERRVLLERFLKEIGKQEFILMSPEFKIFSRGQGDIEKLLGALPKQSPGQILEKYRNSFKIDEEQDSAAVETYKDRIMNF